MAVPVSSAVRLGGARHTNPRGSLTASANEFKHPPGKAVAKIARPIKGFASAAAVWVRNFGKRPDSEVRKCLRRTLMRTSESKGH
jgi:hypothetical protein